MNDEMCNFYIMYFYDSKKYRQEPPGICRWGNLDDNVKFPKGSDQLDRVSDTGKLFQSLIRPESFFYVLNRSPTL